MIIAVEAVVTTVPPVGIVVTPVPMNSPLDQDSPVTVTVPDPETSPPSNAPPLHDTGPVASTVPPDTFTWESDTPPASRWVPPLNSTSPPPVPENDPLDVALPSPPPPRLSVPWLAATVPSFSSRVWTDSLLAVPVLRRTPPAWTRTRPGSPVWVIA